MNGPSPSEEAGDGVSVALATVEGSWAHEQTPSESGSGEQRQKVLGVSAGPCPCGGKGKAGLDAQCAQTGQAVGQQPGMPGQPWSQRMVDSPDTPSFSPFVVFAASCLSPCLCQGKELFLPLDFSTFTPSYHATLLQT